MKTIQMTLDEELVREVDKAARKVGMTRSAFTRRALHSALKHLKLQQLEEQHRQGYARKPVKPGEFDVWEGEQSWSD